MIFISNLQVWLHVGTRRNSQERPIKVSARLLVLVPGILAEFNILWPELVKKVNWFHVKKVLKKRTAKKQFISVSDLKMFFSWNWYLFTFPGYHHRTEINKKIYDIRDGFHMKEGKVNHKIILRAHRIHQNVNKQLIVNMREWIHNS